MINSAQDTATGLTGLYCETLEELSIAHVSLLSQEAGTGLAGPGQAPSVSSLPPALFFSSGLHGDLAQVTPQRRIAMRSNSTAGISSPLPLSALPSCVYDCAAVDRDSAASPMEVLVPRTATAARGKAEENCGLHFI